MKLQCKLHRKGGTRIDLHGTQIHFKPNEAGHHVAEVTDKKHIERLLAIPEAYCIYDPETANEPAPEPIIKLPEQKPAPVVPEDTVLLGSSVHPAEFEIEGKRYQLGAIVGKAHADSGLSIAEWNAADEDDRHSAIDETLDLIKAKLEHGEDPGVQALPEREENTVPKGEAPTGASGEDSAEESPLTPTGEAERAGLVKQYEAKFGKKPNGRASIEKIKAAVEAE